MPSRRSRTRSRTLSAVSAAARFSSPPTGRSESSGGRHGELHAADQRREQDGAGRARHTAALRAAQRSRAERPEIRLRARAVRCVHRAGRRQAGALMCHHRGERDREPDHDHRGPRHARAAASAAARVHRRAGLPVRLLRQRHGDDGEGAAGSQPAADRARHQGGAQRPPLSLRITQSDRACRPARREGALVMSATRRDFLKTGALVIGFTLVPRTALAQSAGLPGSLNTNRRLDAWLRIDPNGTVTIFTGKIELGQGIGTALTQIAADELDVDLKRIDIVYGDTARTPNEGQTAGSLSVEQSGTALRFACAEARGILLAAAAAKLGVPADNLTVSDGTITAPSGGRTAYWELSADSHLDGEATAKVKPKPASEHRVVGTSVRRRDIPKKFTGGAAYVQDVRLPGMVFGRVVRPPS